jgi:hypothetical protein
MAQAVSFAGARCVITTQTRYGDFDDLSRGAFLQLVTRLAVIENDYPGTFPLVVTDTSMDHLWLTNTITSMHSGAVVLDGSDNPGIGPQSISSIQYAYDHGAKYVLCTGPEQSGLADLAILETLLEFLHPDMAPIINVGRDPSVASSLAPVQRITGSMLSRTLACLGLPEDAHSFIRALNRLGMELFKAFNYREYGDGLECQLFPLLDCLNQGFPVGQIFLPIVQARELTEREIGDPSMDECRVIQGAEINVKLMAYAAHLGIVPNWEGRQRAWII